MTPQPPAGVRDILIAARAKIEKPENWTKGAEARTASGLVVYATDRDAVCFCTVGALFAVAPYLEDQPLRFEARAKLKAAIGRRSATFNITEYNDMDHRKHADILALFDRAIALSGDRA